MNTVIMLGCYLLVILIMSFGLGMILGGAAKGQQIVRWELRLISKIGRWILRQVFQTASDIFGYLAKQCGGPKPKKTP